MELKRLLAEPDSDVGMNRHTLPGILMARATRTPDQITLIYLLDGEEDEERITYQQLYEAAMEIAADLTVKITPGDRALMLYPPGLEFVKALFGCFYAGVIAVPAYPPRKNRSLDRLRLLVKDSGATIILSTEDIHQSFERSFTDVTELNALKWNIINNQIPASPPPRPHASTPPRPHAPMPPCLPASMPSDTALLQYTSGSTGQPKGVMVTHQNLVSNLEFLRTAFELTPESISVHWLPVFHDMGLVFGVMEPIYCGYTGILIPPVSFLQKPSRWLRAISNYKATLAGAPNFAYDLCVTDISEQECKELDLSSLKSLYNGAEPVRKATLEEFVQKFSPYGFKAEMFYPTYGMAEATLILSGGNTGDQPVVIHVDKNALENNRIKITDERDTDAYSLVSVGWPRIDTRIIIVNPETSQQCNEEEVGEIWVSGSIVTKGYWNNPEATESVFRAYLEGKKEGPFLRTGDLGFMHNGGLFISGRLKDVIIIRGRNYYPQDIEFLAESSHDALRPNSSAAFSINSSTSERLILVAELKRTAMRDVDIDSVCNAIRTRIAEEMELAVHSIRLLRTASILKTSSGKIQRRACREAYLSNTLEVVGESTLDGTCDEEAETNSGADLVAIQAWLMTWIHLKLKIKLEKIDFSKPIVVYGLNSMKAVQLQQDFLEHFGVTFPPYMFFERISLKELAGRAYKLISEI